MANDSGSTNRVNFQEISSYRNYLCDFLFMFQNKLFLILCIKTSNSHEINQKLSPKCRLLEQNVELFNSESSSHQFGQLFICLPPIVKLLTTNFQHNVASKIQPNFIIKYSTTTSIFN